MDISTEKIGIQSRDEAGFEEETHFIEIDGDISAESNTSSEGFVKETVKEVIKAVGLNEALFESQETCELEENTYVGTVISSDSGEDKSSILDTKENDTTDSVQNSQIDSDEEVLVPRKKSCLVNGKSQEESPAEQNIIGNFYFKYINSM